MTNVTLTSRQFDDLKSTDAYAAGVHARKAGMARSYGCHFGMRSTYEASVREFNRGYDAPITPIRWDVTNRITGKTTSYKTSAAASRAVDRMDNAYGAYICTRRAIYA